MSRLQGLGNTVFALDVKGAYQSGNKGKQPTKALPELDLENWEYAPWGRFGDLPTRWQCKLEESTIAAQAFYKQANIAFGKGVAYYKDIVEDEEVIGRKYLKIKEIETFFKKNKINKFILRRLYQYVILGNLCCEFITSMDKSKILKVRHLNAEFCRLSRLSKNGTIERVGYSPDWKFGDFNIKDVIDIPLLDEFDYMEQMIWSKRHKFALWSKIPFFEQIYYALPPWAGLFKEDGWLDVSNRVPKLISVLQQNQTKIKYIIRVSQTVWTKWYPKWNEYTAQQMEDAIEKKKIELNDLLKGKDGDLLTIRSFISVSFVDPHTGKPEPGITVEAVDDKLKTGDWIPDSQAADQQITQTIGLDPSETGLQPSGGKMGAGSGSDKRVSRINAIGLNCSLEEVILEPLDIIRDFNGWDEDIKFTFKHTLPTTLDQNKKGITEKTEEA